MNAASRDRVLFALALLVGAGTWFGVAWASGRREAWDAPLFTSVGLPIAYGACLVFGALSASAVLGSGGGLTLWPLTLLLLGLMAGAGLIPTFVGVGLRRLFDARRARRAAADARLQAFMAAPGS